MYLLGVDEAGRGPLAGPVAVGVVKVEDGFDFTSAFPGLNDSKKLTEKKREELFVRLQEEIHAGRVSAIVHFSSAASIDARGIVPSVRSALHSGICKLLPNPEEGKVYLDGALRAPDEYLQETIIGGDATIPAIMLASVAAKVSRDRYMKKIAEQYPLYGFGEHKGYGTPAHYAALREHGLCAIHRTTFVHLETV